MTEMYQLYLYSKTAGKLILNVRSFSIHMKLSIQLLNEKCQMKIVQKPTGMQRRDELSACFIS